MCVDGCVCMCTVVCMCMVCMCMHTGVCVCVCVYACTGVRACRGLCARACAESAEPRMHGMSPRAGSAPAGELALLRGPPQAALVRGAQLME